MGTRMMSPAVAFVVLAVVATTAASMWAGSSFGRMDWENFDRVYPGPKPTPFPTATPLPPSIGGRISIGEPSHGAGQIEVPILISAAPDPYSAFQVHLTFDGSLLTVASARSGGALETSGARTFCVGPIAWDGGNGVVFACTTLGSGSTTSAGTLATIRFKARPGIGGAPTCTTLHLFSYGPPDNGGADTGTFTLAPRLQVQQNTYGPDASLDVRHPRRECSVDQSTATPAATATPKTKRTATPVTVTPTASQSATVTPSPSLTPAPVETATPPPTPTAGTPLPPTLTVSPTPSPTP